MNKLLKVSTFVALALSLTAHAKPQQYLECTGNNVEVDIGVNSVDAASDDILLEVDLGSAQPVVYYATVEKGSVKTALENGLDFVDRDGNQSHASFKLAGKHGDLTYNGKSATLKCP